MSIRGVFFSYLALISAGIVILPLVSYGWIPDNLRKLHEESIEQKDTRREQFRQDILEKRKEVLSKWADRKQDFGEKLREERERIKSGFELRRPRKEIDASGTMPTETQEQEIAPKERFFSIIKKSTQDIANFFSPLKDLFGDRGR